MATRYCPVHSWGTAGVRGNRACNNTDKMRQQNQFLQPDRFFTSENPLQHCDNRDTGAGW